MSFCSFACSCARLETLGDRLRVRGGVTAAAKMVIRQPVLWSVPPQHIQVSRVVLMRLVNHRWTARAGSKSWAIVLDVSSALLLRPMHHGAPRWARKHVCTGVCAQAMVPRHCPARVVGAHTEPAAILPHLRVHISTCIVCA